MGSRSRYTDTLPSRWGYPSHGGVPCCKPTDATHGAWTSRSSLPLTDDEVRDLLKQLEGNWKFIDCMGKAKFTRYQEVMVTDDSFVLSGGSAEEVFMPNRPFKEQFHFFRGPKREIYFDYTGSMFTKLDVPGQVEVESSLGVASIGPLETTNHENFAFRLVNVVQAGGILRHRKHPGLAVRGPSDHKPVLEPALPT